MVFDHTRLVDRRVFELIFLFKQLIQISYFCTPASTLPFRRSHLSA